MGTTKKKPVRRVSINRRVGLPKPRVFYGKTKAEAERKYQQAVQDYQLECLSPKERRYTYRQIATAYEDYITGPLHPIRKGTVNAYRLHIKPTREYFGDTVMNDIDAQAVRGYLERMKVAGKSKHTIANARGVISCIFSYWCAEYHGTNNPALLAKLPSGMQYGRRKEPTEEQRRLINAHPEGCGFWAWLFEYTGLRMGEGPTACAGRMWTWLRVRSPRCRRCRGIRTSPIKKN